MKSYKGYLFLGTVGALIALLLAFPAREAAQIPPATQLISQSSLLSGLAPGAVFPFIDTTPNTISRAHIAVTDATSGCSAGAAAPGNIQILVGQAGVALVNVMIAETNTGISTISGQCVFHVTVRPGVAGVPATITDIVVHNNGSSALTGINTITASAEVR